MVEPYAHPDEARKAAWRQLLDECLVAEMLEPGFARRILEHDDGPVRTFAELGGGAGEISKLLAPHGVDCTLVDLRPHEWDGSFRAAVIGDLLALPLRAGSLDAASAVNCLYFLEDPRDGIRQAYDALRTGGLFLASAPSRYHDVELRDVDPAWGTPSPFDAEEAPSLVAAVFGEDALVEVHEWEGSGYLLADTDAIAAYLLAFNIPDHVERAKLLTPPVTITKKGTDVWAVKLDRR